MLYLPCCSPTVVRRHYFYKWCNELVISGCFLSIIASDGDRTVQLAACVEKQTTVHELRAFGLYQDWGTRESPSGFFLAWALFHLRLWSSSTLKKTNIFSRRISSISSNYTLFSGYNTLPTCFHPLFNRKRRSGVTPSLVQDRNNISQDKSC